MVENMTYYEKLNVPEHATKMEIKKAYFKLVKQYPPEKYPEEFKGYRKAYEVLFDENARVQYDNLNKVPEEYKERYDRALEAMNYGDYEEAIFLLKEVVNANPTLQILNSLLGDIYLENENSGNAIKIFERLVQLEPENASYQGKLAEAYTMRGYIRKAILQFEKSLEMDPDNMSYWLGLSNAYVDVMKRWKAWEVLLEGMARAKELNVDSLELYIYAVFLCIRQDDLTDIQKYLDVLRECVENDPDIVDYIMNFFFNRINKLKKGEVGREGIYRVVCFFAEIAPGRKDILSLKEDVEKSYAFKKLSSDVNVPIYLEELTDMGLRDCNCISCRIELALIQFDLVYEIVAARKALKYFKENYPKFYDLHKLFYNKVMQPKNDQRLFEELRKKLQGYEKKYPYEFQEFVAPTADGDMEFDKYDVSDDLYDDEVYQPIGYSEPYVREEPKIGRNDPCPCGSGKKYKKCCGR